MTRGFQRHWSDDQAVEVQDDSWIDAAVKEWTTEYLCVYLSPS